MTGGGGKWARLGRFVQGCRADVRPISYSVTVIPSYGEPSAGMVFVRLKVG